MKAVLGVVLLCHSQSCRAVAGLPLRNAFGGRGWASKLRLALTCCCQTWARPPPALPWASITPNYAKWRVEMLEGRSPSSIPTLATFSNPTLHFCLGSFQAHSRINPSAQLGLERREEGGGSNKGIALQWALKRLHLGANKAWEKPQT